VNPHRNVMAAVIAAGFTWSVLTLVLLIVGKATGMPHDDIVGTVVVVTILCVLLAWAETSKDMWRCYPQSKWWYWSERIRCGAAGEQRPVPPGDDTKEGE